MVRVGGWDGEGGRLGWGGWEVGMVRVGGWDGEGGMLGW